jgi:APAF-1 helical domain
LPDTYAWRCVAYHLVQAGRQDDLRRLLLNFNWLQAKLEATNINALISDYDYLLEDKDLQLLQSAIRLSANALASDGRQLIGRLLGNRIPSIQALVNRAAKWIAWPLASASDPQS